MILAILSLISLAASSISILVKNSILIVLLPTSDIVSIDLIPSAPPSLPIQLVQIFQTQLLMDLHLYTFDINTSGG